MRFDKILWNLSGQQIEDESLKRIDLEIECHKFADKEWIVARRLIHTTADFDIIDNLFFRNKPIESCIKALNEGVPIYTDSNMIKSGISVAKLKKFNAAYERESIHCYIADPEVAETAKRENITRALAGVRKAKKILDGGIFLCGNAPLALAGTLKMIEEEGILPALIIGMPVGFVNVIESKELLRETTIPHITIEGRRGGSPLAVAALHGIIEGDLK
ncbi:MAG: precorrin-8X methylmutase [bacterium]|nr:precorrin-8X methylmutase [bacterium]